MRIAMVGLGDIARKAYLPIIAMLNDLEVVLCSRNAAQLAQLAASNRVRQFTIDVGELASMNIDAAFVHTATESHENVVCRLLEYGIHVYVDKPLAYTLREAQRMVALAESTNRLLMVGFNRRYAPMYEALVHKPERRVVIMQKNRFAQADAARRVVFDDFIHVVDTLRFLAPGPIEEVRASGESRSRRLHHVVLQLEGEGFNLLGLMNRDSGIAEETIEVMSPGNKWLVQSLSKTTHYHAGTEQIVNAGDWDTVLWRRGFPQIIQHFVDCIRTNSPARQSAQDSLATHALCEQIVSQLEAGSFVR
ncbi:MAG: Gfo/Idh/MocA family protein [Steroidobacteraceae bacterium]